MYQIINKGGHKIFRLTPQYLKTLADWQRPLVASFDTYDNYVRNDMDIANYIRNIQLRFDYFKDKQDMLRVFENRKKCRVAQYEDMKQRGDPVFI